MLLQRVDDSGYPVEYLAARISVRRSFLTSDWQLFLDADDPLDAIPKGNFLAGSDDRSTEGMWKSLLGEYRWIYRQMDNGARKDFAPYFTWQELKTVVLCLRNMLARENGKILEILEFSLLSQNVKHILAYGEDPPAAVARLEVDFALMSTVFCGMAETFHARGAGGLEQWLNDTWLEWVCGTSLQPVLRDFCSSLVDFRNLMELYKRIRWEMPEAARFLRGGRLGRTSLADALGAGERTVIADLLCRFPGAEGDADPSASPEHYLLRGITRRLRGQSRELSGYGLIIEYLWLVYLETVNMGILLETGKLNRQNAAEELVR
jgi:hypothetical protein